MMTLTQKLLAVADAYAALHERTIPAVSRQILGNSTRLDAIREGGTLTVRSYEQAMSELASDWPDPDKWPSEVEWPAVQVQQSGTA